MEPARYAKRARQACEPCRRKKSRCPGEKPICSYCKRLGQRCFYNVSIDNAEGSQLRRDGGLEQRMGSLEDKMDRLIQQFGVGGQLPQQPTASPQLTLPDSVEGTMSLTPSAFTAVQLQEMGQLYLTWCHNQPIALFSEETFASSLPQRDESLLLALMALSLRFPAGSLNPEKDAALASYASKAQASVMGLMGDGQIELSTLQTLCVLSLYHFGVGNASKASFCLGMASQIGKTVAWSGGAAGELGDCLRSIEVLQRLHGAIVAGNGVVSSSYDLHGSSLGGAGGAPDESSLNNSIASCAYHLCEAWQMARSYAVASVSPDAPPPWDSRSDYSAVMQSHLRIDCRLPLKYRFASNRIADKDIATLQSRRRYWGPFLFLQIAYAAIPCIVNHPFLLSMRLRSFRYTLPQSFVQQSFEHITRHAGWIMYFIDLLEGKGFQVSDPSIAHCVAVVATIHLQHSFSKDLKLKDKAQGGFDTCLRFLRGMGSIWPCVTNMADNLVKLHQSVAQVPSPGVGRAEPGLSIDARLLWDVLIYDRAVCPNAEVDQSMLGQSLRWASSSRHDELTEDEFDLMGSAGISRHKQVPREIPIYAPGEKATQLAAEERSDEQAMPDAGLSLEDVYYEGVGGPADQETLFLQANDYGRAIDSWLSFDETI